MLKRTTANLALVLVGILAAFAVAEIALRITPLGETAFFIYDADRGWTLKPGARGWQRKEGDAYVSVNRWGFRGPDWTLEKPPGAFRVAVLGDSFTEAQQVPIDDTFSSVMQTTLGRCASLIAPGSPIRSVEVMNFGVDGYGTAQEQVTLRREVWKFHPDFVVLSVFTGNDIRNNSVTLERDKCRPFYVYRNDRMILGGPFEDSWRFRLRCMMQFESQHSQVLNAIVSARSVLRAWIRKRRAAQAAAEKAISGRARETGLSPTGSERGIGDQTYSAPQTEVLRDAWRVTEGEIDGIRRDVAAHGARLLVVTLTTGIQVHPDPAVRDGYAKWLGVGDLFYPDDRIKDFGERNGFEVLNLARPLQVYAEQHHAFLHGFKNIPAGSGHWNALGHHVGGELIAAKICEMVKSQRVVKP